MSNQNTVEKMVQEAIFQAIIDDLTKQSVAIGFSGDTDIKFTGWVRTEEIAKAVLATLKVVPTA